MKVGSDTIDFDDGRLIIHAAEPMDWPIREFSRLPIYFEGQKYFVRACQKGKGRSVIYELSPWPADWHESAPMAVTYDECYVAERDRNAVARRGNEFIHLLILPLYPFLGLLWSRAKNRLLTNVGFDPGSVTKASIALTFALFLLEGVFAGWLFGGLLVHFLDRPDLRVVDWILMIVFALDSVMRYGQSLKFDVERHWGFCEWMTCSRVA